MARWDESIYLCWVEKCAGLWLDANSNRLIAVGESRRRSASCSVRMILYTTSSFIFVIDSGIFCRVLELCPFVRFVMVVGWRDFLFLLHRSDNFHRLRTLNHCTTALSVYLGSPVSAIFFEYRAHRWGYYLRKKMWQHNFTGRAHIHLYDDDDDTIFLVTIAAWWRVCAGGGVLLSLCCFALSDDWCRCGCFELHCLSSRRPPGE